MADATDAPKTKEQRHPSLYFDDGDLVISANSEHVENPKQIFRVHKALLAIHSPVFKDMLVVGDDAATERYDGVPLVHLPDPAEDLVGLLDALYLRPLPLEKLHPDNPLNVRGTLRLAMKYEVEGLRKTIIDRVVADWPVNLSEWESREREIQRKVMADASPERSRERTLYGYKSYPEAASAIRFAMEFKCYSILPAAFYALARWDIKQNWGAAKYAGGMPARWQLLEAPDLLRLVAGKMAFHSYTRLDGDYMGYLVQEGCLKIAQPSCTDLALGIVDAVPEHWQRKQYTDPLGYYMYLIDVHAPKVQWCCNEGRSAFVGGVAEKAQELWDELPELFELEGLSK